MLDCFLCHQGCNDCLHDIFETCPNCEPLLLRSQSSQVQDNTLAVHPQTEHLVNNLPLASDIGTSNLVNRHTELAASVSFNNGPADHVQTPPNPKSRRREWTDTENRQFEQWITSNPKPTRLDKFEFAAAHRDLTFQQVQNKINNWRNGRNIEKQRIQPRAIEFGGKASQTNNAEPVKLTKPHLDATSCGSRSSHGFVLGSEDISALTENRYNDFEAMELDSLACEEDNSPAPSITPSIIRYLSSTELEADRDAIESAVQRASQENIINQFETSNLLPQEPSSQYSWWHAMVKDMRRSCRRCEEEHLQCDGRLPCRWCQEAQNLVRECSYHLIPRQTPISTSDTIQFEAPWVGLQDTGPVVSVSTIRKRNYPPRVSTPVYSVIRNSEMPVLSSTYQASRKPSSVAGSVAGSAKSSQSGRSSLSVRYQAKLQRRQSANARRLSAVELQGSSTGAHPPSRQPSRRSLPTIGNIFQTSPRNGMVTPPGNRRTEYLRCPILTCNETFHNRKDLRRHEVANHFDCFCTFCKMVFRDQGLWRRHEQKHIGSEVKQQHLWCCGICDQFGLSEPKRFLHIRKHWQEGYDMHDWPAGRPIVVPLSKEQLESLDDLTDKQFAAKAERLVEQLWRPESQSKGRERTEEQLIRLSERIRYSEDTDEAEPTSMAYGFFASLRRHFPPFRKRYK